MCAAEVSAAKRALPEDVLHVRARHAHRAGLQLPQPGGGRGVLSCLSSQVCKQTSEQRLVSELHIFGASRANLCSRHRLQGRTCCWPAGCTWAALVSLVLRALSSSSCQREEQPHRRGACVCRCWTWQRGRARPRGNEKCCGRSMRRCTRRTAPWTTASGSATVMARCAALCCMQPAGGISSGLGLTSHAPAPCCCGPARYGLQLL